MARAGLLFVCVNYCCIYIGAFATVPAPRHVLCCMDCSPSFCAIDSCELELFYSAPRHGTCWAAVGLRPPPISAIGSSK